MKATRRLNESPGCLPERRELNVPVVFIQHDSTPEPVLARGTAGFDLHERLTPMPGEQIIVKRRPSAFHGTELHRHLQLLGVDSLVVAGMQTEFCVDSTVRSASEHGYKLTLAADGHTTFNTPCAAGAANHRPSQFHAAGFRGDQDGCRDIILERAMKPECPHPSTGSG